MAAKEAEAKSLGAVLVVGGCGFLGYHIIRALLKDPTCRPIHALSRTPNSNLQDGVSYHAGDITDAAALHTLLQEIKPQVIFHTASPKSSDFTVKGQDYLDINVAGTKKLLAAAKITSSVKAFIFSSSVMVFAGVEHIDLDESRPLWEPHSKGTPYDQSKAAAETIVHDANCEDLRTVTIRPCLMYGERDNSFVPGLIGVRTNVQLGDNTNLIDTVSVSNAAKAHLLAATILLNPDRAASRVDGEAFNITDGNPIPFWDLSRLIWRATGDVTPLKDVTVIPVWLALGLASLAEWTFFILTLGQKKPKALNKLVVSHCVRTHTYNINKARQALGYNPVPELENGIKRSVEWEMQKRNGKKTNHKSN